MRTRSKITTKKAIFFTLFIWLFLFLVLEAVCRYKYNGMKKSGWSDHKNYIKHIYSPFSGYAFPPLEKDVFNHTDVYNGWRFPSLDTDKYGFIHNGEVKRDLVSMHKDKIYVMLIGGSTVGGMGASSNNKTIAAQLEKLLNVKEKKYIVINAGVAGYNSFQAYSELIFNNYYKFKPDIVISFDGVNDFVPELMDWKPNYSPQFDTYKTLYHNYVLGKSHLNVSSSFKFLNKYLIDHWKTYFFMRRIMIDKVLSLKENKNVSKKIDLNEEKIKNMARVYSNNIKMLQGFCKNLNIEHFSILQPTILPGSKSFTEREERYFSDRLSRFSGGKKRYMNLFELFFEYTKNSLGECNNLIVVDGKNIFRSTAEEIYIDTCHYNDRGNEIIAKFIYNNGSEQDLW